jgi:hypothetical protein
LKKDLVKKEILNQEDFDTISKLDLGHMLVDYYINYPFAPYETAKFPLNYCGTPRLFKNYNLLKKLSETVLEPFCGSFDLTKPMAKKEL